MHHNRASLYNYKSFTSTLLSLCEVSAVHGGHHCGGRGGGDPGGHYCGSGGLVPVAIVVREVAAV